VSGERTVLVCDDERQILRALRVILRDAGFEVTTAATAKEALDSAALGRLDAAILDLVLPDGDGVEVCRAVREWSDMPIIVLSAVGEEHQKVRALEAGAGRPPMQPMSRSYARTASSWIKQHTASWSTARTCISRPPSSSSCGA
jgi:CheY-like chemotaxis protein